MSDPTTTSDRWHTLAVTSATRTDADYPPAPIVYFVGPAVAITGVVAANNLHQTPMFAVLIVASILAGIICQLAVNSVANRHWDERAVTEYAYALGWLSRRVGDDLTVTIAGELAEPGAFTGWITACRSIERHIPSDDFAALLRRVAGTDQWQVIGAIRAACYPTTSSGWTTSDDACDLTGRAVAAMLAGDDISPEAFRAALRHEFATA